jgi:hypothetical protein
MTKLLSLLMVGVIVALAGCALATQQAVQLPGEPSLNGLQVPPDVGERPAQVPPSQRQA